MIGNSQNFVEVATVEIQLNTYGWTLSELVSIVSGNSLQWSDFDGSHGQNLVEVTSGGGG